MPNADVRVVIIDDHEIVALGLSALLDDEPEITVVGMADSVAGAMDTIFALNPDVVLIDYRLPDGSGIEIVEKLRASEGSPGVVMITATADRRILAQALDAGCDGFLSKSADRSDLVLAVHAAARHESHFTPDVVRHLSHLKRFEQLDAEDLSSRECEVLQLSAEGLSPEQIAEKLYLSSHTVRNHVRNAMTKLQAHSKLEAVVKAARLRLISIDE